MNHTEKENSLKWNISQLKRWTEQVGGEIENDIFKKMFLNQFVTIFMKQSKLI